MSVITISRGSFSGGKMLAECLAAQLGFRCINRDAIVERAAASGVSQEELMDALLKPPSLLDRFSHKKYIYLTLIQAALAEEVRTGKAVYHGNAGHLLLKGGPHVLRVRIIAPLEFRIRMAQERLKMDRSQTIAYIQKVDQERRKWAHYLYGVDWGDPSLYDIVLNLENVSIAEACEVVSTMAKQSKCFDFTPECQASMDDFVLASTVKAKIALNRPTSDLEVEVKAQRGVVSILGQLANPEQLREVRHVASSVPGVTDLNLDGLGSKVQV